MKPSLSVVLPVPNVQTTLAATVEQLLEVLPELTDRFEVVLVDDASTDATSDLAREVSIRYPQVQLLTQSAELGLVESFRGGIRFTHGELLLLCTDRPEFDLHEICKLWGRRKDDGAAWAKVAVGGRLGSIPRPPEGRADSTQPDLLLVPRRLLTGWTMRGERSDMLAYLRQRGYAVERLEIRRLQTAARTPSTIVATGRSFKALPSADVVGASVRRPNVMQSKWRERSRGR